MPAGQSRPSLCSVALGGLSSREVISPGGYGGDNRTICAPAHVGHAACVTMPSMHTSQLHD